MHGDRCVPHGRLTQLTNVTRRTNASHPADGALPALYSITGWSSLHDNRAPCGPAGIAPRNGSHAEPGSETVAYTIPTVRMPHAACRWLGPWLRPASGLCSHAAHRAHAHAEPHMFLDQALSRQAGCGERIMHLCPCIQASMRTCIAAAIAITRLHAMIGSIRDHAS